MNLAKQIIDFYATDLSWPDDLRSAGYPKLADSLDVYLGTDIISQAHADEIAWIMVKSTAKARA